MEKKQKHNNNQGKITEKMDKSTHTHPLNTYHNIKIYVYWNFVCLTFI